jgi:membrane fusion protein (multidrug efflux system)
VRGARKQARVQILDADGTASPLYGVVNFTGSTVDPKLGTVQLRAEVRNDNLQRLPGQFVPVRLLAGEQQAYLVPQAAVVQQEQTRLVWVVGQDGTASLKPVKTANWIGDQWVVTQGLQPADRVIVDNLIKLKPGVRVEVREAEPPQPASAPSAPGSSASSARP